jgi:hypothetical protein
VSDAWDRIGQLDMGAEVEAALQDNPDCQALDREASARRSAGFLAMVRPSLKLTRMG